MTSGYGIFSFFSSTSFWCSASPPSSLSVYGIWTLISLCDFLKRIIILSLWLWRIIYLKSVLICIITFSSWPFYLCTFFFFPFLVLFYYSVLLLFCFVTLVSGFYAGVFCCLFSDYYSFLYGFNYFLSHGVREMKRRFWEHVLGIQQSPGGLSFLHLHNWCGSQEHLGNRLFVLLYEIHNLLYLLLPTLLKAIVFHHKV